MEFVVFLKKTGIAKLLAGVIALLNVGFCIAGSFSAPIEAKNEVKNIIIMIGDGMGPNHLELTKQELDIDLVMETMPYRGFSKTKSMQTVTDSAAGATALACGVRTTNGCVGVYPQDMFAFISYPANLTEKAIEKGMKTGIVTSDSSDGATPAGFSAHTYARGNSEDITAQQLASDIDLIWSAKCDAATEADVTAAGYVYADTVSEFNALTASKKSFGQFGGDTWMLDPETDSPTLEEMTDKAITLLNTNNDDGFFLMVEGAHIDKRSHSQDVDGAVEALVGFDNAIETALEFAKADGDTLVVVTADHETGGITLVNGKYVYTVGSHTAANVPLFVYGSDDFIAQGQAIRNCDVSVTVARIMGLNQQQFPQKIAA